jgi:hypothetical protein
MYISILNKIKFSILIKFSIFLIAIMTCNQEEFSPLRRIIYEAITDFCKNGSKCGKISFLKYAWYLLLI